LLRWSYPVGYPEEAAPIFEVIAPWLDSAGNACVRVILEEMFNGDVVIFQWAEFLRTELVERLKMHGLMPKPDRKETTIATSASIAEQQQYPEQEEESVPATGAPLLILSQGGRSSYRARMPILSAEMLSLATITPNDIVAGEPLTDRKSKFIAHAARVYSEADVAAFVKMMKSNSKIAEATHNIVAFRVMSEGKLVCICMCS